MKSMIFPPEYLPGIVELLLPLMVGQFINVLYSIVDRMYIGHIRGRIPRR